MDDIKQPLFPLGRVLATPGALELFDRLGYDGLSLLMCHHNGNWGDVDPEDWAANDVAVEGATRILSAYNLSTDSTDRVWIITEADRSITTILLPEEY